MLTQLCPGERKLGLRFRYSMASSLFIEAHAVGLKPIKKRSGTQDSHFPVKALDS